MKSLKKFIKSNYRVIEFGTAKNQFTDQLNLSDKFLKIIKSNSEPNNGEISLSEVDFLTAIKKNSTDVIILNDAGWRELKALQRTFKAVFLFEKITVYNILFILYFLLKGMASGRVKYKGLFFARNKIKISVYIGIRKIRFPRQGARHYLSPKINLIDFFHELNSQNIKYCILRWFENLPKLEHNEDIDLLADDDDIEKIHLITDEKPGIIPFDIYSKSGLPGSDYNFLPYYVFSLADDALKNIKTYKEVFKVPTWEFYFYLLAYHVVFHKGEESGIPSLRYKLKINNNPDHDYVFYLKSILEKTSFTITEFTLEGLHHFLDEEGYAPPLDTQYKLSVNNQYLRASLDDHYKQNEIIDQYEGLACFVIREKIIEADLLPELKKFISKEGFTIIQTEKLKDSIKNRFTKHVRGGNWNQGPWPSNGGMPSVIIVALDVYPVQPKPDVHKKHPGLTNERIRRKEEIRDFLNMRLPSKKDWCNGIHSSDNEIQAVEYLTLAGLDKGMVLDKINEHKRSFKTKYSVIKTLSQYSRRAKVELINYHGEKAVIKTFKPNCELFLSNEIEAYNVFKEFNEIPKLLEVGDNYFITSYIKRVKTLGNKISIKTLKNCLDLLGRIYDKGYSLLDFKPANFLIDRKKNIYLIDFEFLYKYKNKPTFMNCYDLVGFPESIDLLYRPDVDIPEDKKMFDIKWGQFTGISYDDLLRLNLLSTYIKSNLRFYNLRLKKLLTLILNKGINKIKVIHKAIP